jgi:hypothetical protein
VALPWSSGTDAPRTTNRSGTAARTAHYLVPDFLLRFRRGIRRLRGVPALHGLQRQLRPLIAAALAQKGYVPATGKGDVFIRLGSGLLDISREIGDLEAGWLPDDEAADFVAGSLVIDAFDGAEGHRMWHAASRANINPDQIDHPRPQHSVKELLSLFPEANTGVQAGP